MKKTEKTALTAALFAAALNFVPTGASAASDDPVKAAREEMAGVYGPPPQYTDTIEPVETVPTQTTTTAMPQPVYGPPPVEFVKTGDFDGDGRVTAFDMVLMRKRYVDRDFESYEQMDLYDLNEDSRFGVADMVMLQRYLMGRIDGFSEEDSLSEEEAIIALKTTTGMAPVYGPPWIFDPSLTTTVDPPLTTVTTDEMIALYGPPWAFDPSLTTAAEEPFDPITTTREVMADVYGPPAWYGQDEE